MTNIHYWKVADSKTTFFPCLISNKLFFCNICSLSKQKIKIRKKTLSLGRLSTFWINRNSNKIIQALFSFFPHFGRKKSFITLWWTDEIISNSVEKAFIHSVVAFYRTGFIHGLCLMTRSKRLTVAFLCLYFQIRFTNVGCYSSPYFVDFTW